MDAEEFRPVVAPLAQDFRGELYRHVVSIIMTLVELAIVGLCIERPCPSDSHRPKSDKLGRERGSYLYACPHPFRFHIHGVGSWWFVVFPFWDPP